ncbi:MAG: class I SAM-dependent methyltransferase, partial [Planctomycetes bacterium]|nr:class I SAM-dependent methyltransferase [Planctomycetota bacterium]
KTHLQWCLRYLSYGKGAKILDIGAGHGGAVKAFRDLGFSAEGLELDPNLCAAAKDRFGVTLTPVDVMAADIPAQSNDLIYSSHVHEHFDNWQEVNQRLWTWLKPGGCLLVVVPTYRLSALNGRGFINVFHNSIFTRTSLDNMFKLGGFIPQAFHYPKSHSKAEVWGLAVKGGPPEKHPLSRDNAYLIWLELYCGTIVIEAIYRIIEGIARLTAPLRHRLRQRQLPHQTNSEAKKDNI